MPQLAGVTNQITNGERRKVQELAYALQYYAELLLVGANRNSINKSGVSINKNDRARRRRLAFFAKPIRQSKENEGVSP